MDTETAEACNTCRFWRPLTPGSDSYADDRNYQVDDHGAGICRRFPPGGPRLDAPVYGKGEQPNATDQSMWAQWPVTDGEDDWCGEFRA